MGDNGDIDFREVTCCSGHFLALIHELLAVIFEYWTLCRKHILQTSDRTHNGENLIPLLAYEIVHIC